MNGDRAWLMGYAARAAGLAYAECPFWGQDSALVHQWQDGWCAAYNDKILADYRRSLIPARESA